MVALPLRGVYGYDGLMAYGKKVDGRGKHRATPITDFRKQRLLEWLCTVKADRNPKTLEELSDELGTPRRTLTDWKVEKEFVEEWEHRYRRTVGSPERAQAVLETMYCTATDRDDPKHVQAGKQYLEAIDAVKPQKIDVTVSKGAAQDLTDSELAVLIAERAEAEQSDRQDETA